MRQLKIVNSITTRVSDSFDKYLQEIGKEDLITAEEEVILARKIRVGDLEALHKLVKANLRFVISVAKQYQNQGLSLIDLVNEGNLGLIKSAEKFDETKGFKFISYAVWWIRQSIMQAIMEQSRIVRLPNNKIGDLTKIKRASSKLEQDFEREPSTEEMADQLDIPEYQVADSLKFSDRQLSVDAPFLNNQDHSLLDVLSNADSPKADGSLMSESLHHEIERALATLDDREREIIKMTFGIGLPSGLTLAEISEKFYLTRERVRQIREKAIGKLRKQSTNKILKTYL